MEDGLVEQLGNVRVVEPVDDLLAASLADYESEVAQLSQLMRDRGGLHADGVGEFADRASAVFEATEDLQPADGFGGGGG